MDKNDKVCNQELKETVKDSDLHQQKLVEEVTKEFHFKI